MHTAHIPNTNHAKGDAVIRAGRAISPEHAAGDDGGKADGADGETAFEERAAVHGVVVLYWVKRDYLIHFQDTGMRMK